MPTGCAGGRNGFDHPCGHSRDMAAKTQVVAAVVAEHRDRRGERNGPGEDSAGLSGSRGDQRGQGRGLVGAGRPGRPALCTPSSGTRGSARPGARAGDRRQVEGDGPRAATCRTCCLLRSARPARVRGVRVYGARTAIGSARSAVRGPCTAACDRRCTVVSGVRCVGRPADDMLSAGDPAIGRGDRVIGWRDRCPFQAGCLLQAGWMRPMVLPSASVRVAISLPPPTSLTSCCARAPTASSALTAAWTSATCQ